MKYIKNLFILVSLFVIGLNETLIKAQLGRCIIECSGNGRVEFAITTFENLCIPQLAINECSDWNGKAYPRSRIVRFES